MYFLTLVVVDLVRLYLRTSGRTEGSTLTKPCVILKKRRQGLIVRASSKKVKDLKFVDENCSLVKNKANIKST